MAYYIENKETGKIELHFDKSEYSELTENQKREIRSNFLFSKYAGAWVSRCKFPNLYRPRKVAEDLGLENAGKTGERLSFEEQQEKKAEKAERRAERMEYRAEKAAERAESLQKPIHDMHGDIAFFTQPNINSAGGRAFTRRRERMFAAYDRGFEEFKKSEYYAGCAETARKTAEGTKPTDKGFCQRRIDEAEKTIRAQRKNLELYNQRLEKLNAGESIKHYNGSEITIEEVEEWIERAEDILENAIQKSVYYHDCIEAAGGVICRENLNKGDIVKITRWGAVRIIRFGSKNFTFEYLDARLKYADGSQMQGKASYAEIEMVVKKAV